MLPGKKYDELIKETREEARKTIQDRTKYELIYDENGIAKKIIIKDPI